MASPNGVESTWNDAFVKVMLDTIKKFIDGKKKETGQFNWLSGMQNLGVALDDVDVALIAQDTRSELDEKGDQVDELDVRQFLNETLGMWVDAYTGANNQLPSDSIIADARNIIESLMWDSGETVNINGDIITYPNIVNYRIGVVGLGEITPFQDIHTIFDRQFISAERRPLYLHQGDKLNAYLDALENAGILDSKTRFDPNVTEPIREQFFAEGGIYDHISQRAGINPALTTVATKYINWGMGTGTEEDQKEFGYLTTHAGANPLTRTEYADIFEAEQQVESIKLEDYDTVTGDADDLRKWIEGTILRRFPAPSSGDPLYDEYEQWITNSTYEMEQYVDSLLQKLKPDGTLAYTQEDVITLATNYASKLHLSRPDVEGASADAAAQKAVDDSYSGMKTASNFTTAAAEAVKTILNDVGAVIPDYAKNAIANILKNSYQEHIELGLPAPDDVEVLSPYRAQMENWVAQGKVDTSDIAEGILGITRFTPSDIATDLEGATADLIQFIDEYLEDNPLTPFSREQIGQGFMDQYAITPEGNLVPSYLPRTSTYTGRMWEHPLGRLQLGLDPVTQWDPATETWTTVEDRWGGLPDTPFSDAFGFPTAPEGTQAFDVDRFIESAQIPQRSAADEFIDAFEAWSTGRPATDVRQEQLGFPFPNIPDMSMEWAQGYGTFDEFDPITGELTAKGGPPAYDYRTFSRELDEQFSRGYLKKYNAEGDLVPWTAQDVADAKDTQLRSQAGDPIYPTNYFAQPTEAQMRAPFEEMFGGSAAGREFIGRKLSDPDFFTGLSTQLGALPREGLRHPQTIPTDPMSVVSGFSATKAPSLAAEFKQEQEEERARRSELTGAGSTIFKRRTL